MLVGRYRIVNLLGKGGMGEVYRADDLRLGQSVALKFLPTQFAKDSKRIEYFYNEVRLARQISHPNVCRVYDIGEVNGHHFLSMEYVDGEDLATLIRRIGRLPQDKGLDIAHQLCAGLVAAHDRGVLHRDLKPSNIMLDGRGRVKITDFSLAQLVSERKGPEAAVGTPAYMAPEQLDKVQLTKQSDIFSLGLILFEIFTGKRVYDADSMDELIKQRESFSPEMLSVIVPELDPKVERVIQRCLEKKPQNRPRSVLEVAALLPGGDPLAAALAAGETPSPEIVASAGESGRLHPRIAIGWLAALLLGLIATAFLADKATVLGTAGLHEKPDALEKVARDVIDDLGYDMFPKDRAYGFQYDTDYLWMLRIEESMFSRSEKTKHVSRPGMYFWYRQSPQYLLPLAKYAWMVSKNDPPPTLTGMVGLCLKGNGDLIEFYAVPQKIRDQVARQKNTDWERFFKHAGLVISQFTELKDEHLMGLPPIPADYLLVWEGLSPSGEQKVRVEAASYRGTPIYFKVSEPRSLPQGIQLGIPPSDKQPMRIEKSRAVEWTAILIILVAAAFVARRSLRLGRSDRKGAFRLGLFIFAFNFLAWVFEASHVPNFSGELALVLSGLREAMFYAVYFGLMYLAFEPYVRRFWPKLLISWNRLLNGQLDNPRVGRDILVGAAVGVWFWPILEFLTVLAPDWLGPVHPFWRTIPSTLLGGRHLLAVGLFCLSAVGVALTYLLGLGLLRILFRKWWLWAPIFIFQGTFFFILSDVSSPARWIVVVALMTSLLLLYTQLGLLAAVSFFYASYVLTDFPLTANLGAWYWSSSLFALIIVAAVGLYSFFISTARSSHVRDVDAPI